MFLKKNTSTQYHWSPSPASGVAGRRRWVSGRRFRPSKYPGT